MTDKKKLSKVYTQDGEKEIRLRAKIGEDILDHILYKMNYQETESLEETNLPGADVAEVVYNVVEETLRAYGN